MRYAQRGGYTLAEQQRRERLRLEAGGRLACGDGVSEIARDPRVAVSRCSPLAVAAAGLLLPERFSRGRPQPGYRSGYDQG